GGSFRGEDVEGPGAAAQPEAEEHGGDEGERARREEGQGRKRRTRTIAADPPADAEDRGTRDERPVDLVAGREVELRLQHWLRLAPGQAIADEGDRRRAQHHEGEARVPGTREIKEV